MMDFLNMLYIVFFFVRGRASMNFYNSQWVIRDFGKLWSSIRFKYEVYIFYLLRSTITIV